jgi:hypothetical protein
LALLLQVISAHSIQVLLDQDRLKVRVQCRRIQCLSVQGLQAVQQLRNGFLRHHGLLEQLEEPHFASGCGLSPGGLG